MQKEAIIAQIEYKIECYAENITSLYMTDNAEKQLSYYMSVQKALIEFKDILENID